MACTSTSEGTRSAKIQPVAYTNQSRKSQDAPFLLHALTNPSYTPCSTHRITRGCKLRSILSITQSNKSHQLQDQENNIEQNPCIRTP